MRCAVLFVLFLLLALGAAVGPRGAAAQAPGRPAGDPPARHVLWYDEPAARWEEALPVGSGALGAMVFGGVREERVALNEETIWAGEADDLLRYGAHRHLDEARRLLFDERYAAAESLMQAVFVTQRPDRSYQPLGDLRLTLGLPEDAEITRYRRSLDLDSALAHVAFAADGAAYRREVFASAPDGVVAVRLTTDRPGGLRLDVRLDRSADAATTAEGDRLVLRGRATQGGEQPGVRFEGHLRALADGGRVLPTPDGLRVDGASAVTLLLAAATDYDGGDPARARGVVDAAAARGYDALRARHVADHARLFDRVALDLGGPDRAAVPTDERLAAVQAGGVDPGLEALYVQYGRYLLIASSRPGGLPANLQGVWNEHLHAPWNADYHTNINVQMNYWPAEPLALSELHEPLFRLVDSVRVSGARTARALYDADGFVVHHTTDAWWFTEPTGHIRWTMWPTGGAWLTRHLWEHYAFTQDTTFLRTRAYPALRDAAAFFLDYLVEDPETGLLVSGPSNSPENSFVTAAGDTAYLTMGPSMDQQIVSDLFTNLLEAAEVLGERDAFTAAVADARARLSPPVRIGPDGRLMEWPRPFEEAEPGHRHVSHLYALHPGRGLTPATMPEEAAAARRTLEHRLAHGGGHTGWSRAWLINFWARLGDGDEAHEHLRLLLAKSTYPNLFDDHPPFQIDGNFGGAAGVAEMLLQSHDGTVHLLPALPAAWPTGRAAGLRARGAVGVDVAWTDGALTSATLRPDVDGPIRLRAGVPVEIRRDGRIVPAEDVAPGEVVFAAAAGAAYAVRPVQ